MKGSTGIESNPFDVVSINPLPNSQENQPEECSDPRILRRLKGLCKEMTFKSFILPTIHDNIDDGTPQRVILTHKPGVSKMR